MPARRLRSLLDPSLWITALLMLVVAQTARHFAQTYHGNVIDDAYISFRYASNWFHGHGLVFNPGERVEGYTNFLWVAMLTPLVGLSEWLGFDFTRSVIGIGTALAVANLGLLYAVARRILPNDWFSVAVVVLLCALDNAYVGYAVSGMENHLLMLWLLGFAYVWLTSPRYALYWMGSLLGLACLTRPDALLAVVAYGAVVLVPWAGKGGERSRPVLIPIAIWAAAFGAYFVWRWSYYGALLPNTFYLKVGLTPNALGRGIVYTLTFLSDRYYLPLIALLGLRRLRHPAVKWLALFVGLHVGYVLYVGGDFYSGHRFYVSLLPLVYVLVGIGLQELRERIRLSRVWRQVRRSPVLASYSVGGGAGAVALAIALFTARGYERGPYAAEILRWGEQVDLNVRYMKWLGRRSEAATSLVTGDIGAAGFLGGLRVVDVFGVIDPAVAHQRVKFFGSGKAGHEKLASREHLLSRSPTYVKWDYIAGDLDGDGYYLFTDFPADLPIDGLWIRDELEPAGILPDTVWHFDPSEMGAWDSQGDAFHVRSVAAPRAGEPEPRGQRGWFVSSYSEGRGGDATGKLVSSVFALVGEKLLLRVGGGRCVDRLTVSLLVDGQRVRTTTGHGHAILGRRVWDIAEFRGRQARLEIVDDAPGAMGYLLVDEVAQWARR